MNPGSSVPSRRTTSCKFGRWWAGLFLVAILRCEVRVFYSLMISQSARLPACIGERLTGFSLLFSGREYLQRWGPRRGGRCWSPGLRSPPTHPMRAGLECPLYFSIFWLQWHPVPASPSCVSLRSDERLFSLIGQLFYWLEASTLRSKIFQQRTSSFCLFICGQL